MLVVDVHALQAVDFLNFVDEVLLQFLLATNVEDVVRVAGAIHERIAGCHTFAFLHVDMNAARQRVFPLLPVVAHDIEAALALADFAVLHDTVDFRHDGGFTRLARFEEFNDTRQTARDVLGLRGFARNLGENVARVDLFAIANHEVRVGRHEVLLAGAAAGL